jgi:hypothetical protein
VETAEAGARRSGGVIENAQLPETVRPTYATLSKTMRNIYHGYNLSEMAEELSAVDDALDIRPQVRESLGKAHRHHINEMLMRPPEILGAGGVAHVNPGGLDVESIPIVCCSNAEIAAIAAIAAGEGDIYGQDRDAAASWADAFVNHNAAIARNLTLALIDNVWQNIGRIGGTNPTVYITGWDTLMTWSQLLQAQQRFLETRRVIPTFGGVQGVGAGIEAGFLVASYMGRPIMVTHDTVDILAQAGNTITPIYMINTNTLKLLVAQPTMYFETGYGADMIRINRLGMEGGYHTKLTLRCYKFRDHGKLRDLQ